MKTLIGLSEAARILGVSKRAVIDFIRAGKLPGACRLHTGKQRAPWMIPIVQVEALAQARNRRK